MALYSNYNMLAVPLENKHEIGDIFICPPSLWHRFWKFHELRIINIDYSIHKRLWFDWGDWQNNTPQEQQVNRIHLTLKPLL